jgi:hypothetical protein
MGEKEKGRCMSFGYWIRITNAERKRGRKESKGMVEKEGRNQENTTKPPKSIK